MKGYLNQNFELEHEKNGIQKLVSNVLDFSEIDTLVIGKVPFTIMERTFDGSNIECIVKENGNTYHIRFKVETKYVGNSTFETTFKFLGKSLVSLETLKILFKVSLVHLDAEERMVLVDLLNKPMTADEIYISELKKLWKAKKEELLTVGVPSSDLPDFETWQAKYLPLVPKDKQPILGKQPVKTR